MRNNVAMKVGRAAVPLPFSNLVSMTYGFLEYCFSSPPKEKTKIEGKEFGFFEGVFKKHLNFNLFGDAQNEQSLCLRKI